MDYLLVLVVCIAIEMFTEFATFSFRTLCCQTSDRIGGDIFRSDCLSCTCVHLGYLDESDAKFLGIPGNELFTSNFWLH